MAIPVGELQRQLGLADPAQPVDGPGLDHRPARARPQLRLQRSSSSRPVKFGLRAGRLVTSGPAPGNRGAPLAAAARHRREVGGAPLRLGPALPHALQQPDGGVSAGLARPGRCRRGSASRPGGVAVLHPHRHQQPRSPVGSWRTPPATLGLPVRGAQVGRRTAPRWSPGGPGPRCIWWTKSLPAGSPRPAARSCSRPPPAARRSTPPRSGRRRCS